MPKYFDDKNQVSLAEVLENRDRRRAIIDGLSQKNPEKSVLAYKLNIPGPQKINSKLIEVFDRGEKDLEKILDKNKISYKLMDSWTKNTGKEAIYLVGADGYKLKKLVVGLEEGSNLARLYDIDVIYKNKNIERKDLGLSPRKCFICGKIASSCARSRAHSIGEMLDYIENLIETEL